MSWGRFASNYERRINFDRMRIERLERVLRSARDRGFEALLLLHGENQHYAGHNTGKYITGTALGNRFIFLPVKSETPILYDFGMWYRSTKDNVDWMEVRATPSFVPEGPSEAREIQYKKAAATIKNDLKNAGLSQGKLAVDVYHLPLMKALEKEGVRIEMGAMECLTEARSIKTIDEMECLRTACAMAEGGFEKLRTSIRPGAGENELRAIFVGELYRLGMDTVPTGEISSGPRTFVNYPQTSDRLVRHGDLIIAMCCQSSFMGYRVCIYRTYVCGRANQDQKDSYARTRDLVYAASKALKPGATTKDIVECWPPAEEFGFENEDAALWTQWGHGIGLGDPEEPTSSRLWSLDYPKPYREGMTIALENWFPTKERSGTYPKGQSTRLEEMFVVTSGGADLMTKYPSDELIECTS